MDGVTLDQWLRILQVAAIAASAGLNVYLYYKTKNTTQQREHRSAMARLENDRRVGDAKLHQRIDAVSGEHTGLTTRLDRRLSVVETTIKHMPTHADLNGIRSELASLNSGLSAIGERNKSNNEMLHSIQLHLMGNDQ